MDRFKPVMLEREADGEKFAFSLAHAEAILSMKPSGWRLPQDSPYQFTNGSLTRSADSGSSEKRTQRKRAGRSE